jgi:hypothetical protein
MTLPHERSIALYNTREFLRRLLDRSATPKVPKHIRTEAYWALRHFPSDFDIARASKKCPEIFGECKDLGEPDLPFQEIDGEEFLDSSEPNEALKKLMKGE